MNVYRTVIIAFLLFLGCRAACGAEGWQELGSDHFVVYYVQDENFAREVAAKAEKYYVQIASDLGYPRYSEFWTWNNRVKIYIFGDRASYLKVSKQPDWSDGMADYTHKQILSYAGSARFVEGVLPHETAHLIFRDFVGFKGEVPVWLDEGVAQWAEPFKREKVKTVSKYLLSKGMLFSVGDMVALDIRRVTKDSALNIRSVQDKDGNRSVFSLNGDAVVSTFYVEAVSLVGFLIERYGGSCFTDFCRQLRDGKRLDEALRFAYATYITGVEELERKWLEYLEG